ncbi:unnamed protein product, partial [Pleuronectes platessa]
DNVVCLSPRLAQSLGNMGQLCVCTGVTSTIHLIDPNTLQSAVYVCIIYGGPESSTNGNLRKHMQVDKTPAKREKRCKYRNELQIEKRAANTVTRFKKPNAQQEAKRAARSQTRSKKPNAQQEAKRAARRGHNTTEVFPGDS